MQDETTLGALYAHSLANGVWQPVEVSMKLGSEGCPLDSFCLNEVFGGGVRLTICSSARSRMSQSRSNRDSSAAGSAMFSLGERRVS